MSTVWNTYRIEDIADKITIGPFGSRMKSDAYVESGVPVIRGTNLTGSKKFSGDWVFISEQLAKQLENCCVSNGDLVFPHRGSIGEVGLVDNQFHQYMMSSSLMKLRCNPNIADSEFIYYFFKSHQGRYELLKNASQVGTPGIGQPLTSLKNIEIKLPSLGEQRKIAKILSDLDDKIHINNQINQTLESIAQALFKSWFVDFDPVRAKIAAKQEGKDPELAAMCAISGKSEAELKQMSEEDFAELQATATLFPDELVESELGEVPKGWELQQFKDIAKYTSNKISLNDLTLENYISTENMLSEKKGIEKASSLPKVNSVPAFKKGNILVSNIRPYFKKIWFSSSEGGHSNDVLNFEVLEEGCEEYLYNLIYQDSFFDQMMASSKGSKMPRGDKKAIMSFQVVIPSITLRRLYSRKVEKFYFKKNVIEKENQILKIIRDTLLPKLLSGEINVSSLKDKVE
ncbi:restriction endonuclease subunit S [Acinetobacter baumannii]|uniref:restriction endonuclease subunit S n=1 Tax=Acinetobacter baumannii TaxID=470 RepID=UPI003892B431